MCQMTVDGSAVYWTDPGEVQARGASTTGSVVMASLAHPAPVVLAKGQDRPCYVAVDEQNVYFSTQSIERIKYVPKNVPASADASTH
jgi:hypothetical protein